MENTISSLITSYLETHNEDFFEEIIYRFQPLIKSYARKLYYLEYEDCIQELTLAIYEALIKIKHVDNEYACISYINKSVIHKFSKLYRVSVEVQINQNRIVNLDLDYNQKLKANLEINNCLFNIDLKEQLQKKTNIEQKIICLILLGFIDEEIGKKLGYTRQYINRIKKQILVK